jgi:serine/threonine protein kinase
MADEARIKINRQIFCIREGDQVRSYEVDPEIDRAIKQTLRGTGKYHDIALFHEAYNEAGTRFCYRANWGLGNNNHRIPVLAKADKPRRFMKSPRAKIHNARGYGTLNDILFLTKIANPEKYSLSRIRDFFMPELSTGERLFISVEDFFENSESLERRVKRQTLNYSEFWELLEDLSAGINYLNNTLGIYHRDLKPSNILIRQKQNREHKHDNILEVRITDFANACKTEDIERKTVPTAGGHFVTNPFLFESLTEVPDSYDSRSELYAIGATMYYALTGKYLIEADPLTGEATFDLHGNRVNLLDSRGKIDKDRYKELIKKRFKVHHLLDPLRKNSPNPRVYYFFESAFLAPLKDKSCCVKRIDNDPIDRFLKDPLNAALCYGVMGALGGMMLHCALFCYLHHVSTRQSLRAHLPYTSSVFYPRYSLDFQKDPWSFRTNGVLDYLEMVERELKINPSLTNSVYSPQNVQREIKRMVEK